MPDDQRDICRHNENIQCQDMRCNRCKHSRLPTKKGGQEGDLVCQNEQSPCNRRKVKGEDYCPYGERKLDDEKTY